MLLIFKGTHCFCYYAKPLVVIEIILGSSTFAGACLLADEWADSCFLALCWSMSCSWKFEAVALLFVPLATPPLLCFSYL